MSAASIQIENFQDKEADVSDWIAFGREVLEVEAAAIKHAAEQLGADFLRAVDLLNDCTGKIVATGVGKSGIAARKLAATLTSNGCPAVYLHPSEAMHGDLGIVAPQDIVIALSNGGESEELLAILPTLLARGVKIIAIVGSSDSTLAQRSAVVLDASIEREACPLNLAPTTSVVVAMAIGDALAMTLQKKRNFRAEDYALNHPGGRLGRRLTLRVSDIMRHGEEGRPVVSPTATFQEVLCEITGKHLGATGVADARGSLAGIITEYDFRSTIQNHGKESFALTAESMMNTCPALVLRPDQLAFEAMQAMKDRPHALSIAPVVDANECYIGMIHITDLVRAGL